MDELKGQVQRARRRLNLQAFLGRLPWCLCAGFTLAAIAIGVAKWYPVAESSMVWNLSWLGGALVVGIASAAIWSWVARLDNLAAAVEVDHRFDLKERVSSSLSLSPDQSESEAGQALIGDAEARVRRINVVDRFRLQFNRRSLVPFVPVVLAGLIIFVIDDAQPSVAKNVPTQQQFQERAKKNSEAFRKRLQQRRKQASEKGLAEADALLKKLERELDELERKGLKSPKEALVKLNNLAEEIKKRQTALGGKKALKEQLAKLKNFKGGPAEKLAQAMKQGKLNKALEQIETLQEKMAQQNLKPEDQQALAQQLKQMKKQLDNAVEKFEKKQKELDKQIEQAKAAGDQEKANQLQEKKKQMQQQAGDMNQLKQMAQKMGKCAECAGNGDMQQAQKALGDMAGDLKQMQREMEELETLEMAMEDLQQCKNGMCQGGGKPGAGGQGQGNKQGQKQMAGLGQGGGKGKGDGLGKGHGRGDRPIAEDDTSSFDTQVRQNVTDAKKAVAIGSADGPNAKRQYREDIRAAYENKESQRADALSEQRLPKGHRKFVEDYFDGLRNDSDSE